MSLELNNLSYAYKGENAMHFPDISLKENENVLILGKSGTGKTTLLHLLGGLIKPKTGSFSFGNQNLFSFSGKELDQFRGKNIGIIFQVPHFVQSINVVENLLLAQKLSGNNTDQKLIESYLDQLNLGHKKNSKLNQLSQGEKQRISIIRALINEPKLILADEPTSALDDSNCDAVISLLKNKSDEIGASLMVVTHDNRLKNHFSKTINIGE